ncbi:MAG: type VI secretion system baseplate subunit TssF, partial [Planctomycetes bacterium]|nr:type VI secretion system baseplate subunit TssF [Planctomycetota bacterium]
MTDDLLFGYFERELDFVHNLADEFAQRYPDRAGQLLFHRNRSDDPHVERLIQAFAFIAARIQLRLDDDYPELADALLQLLYPHAITPLPAVTTAQFKPHPQQGRARQGIRIPRHTAIKTKKLGDIECRFRTAYPLVLWPLVLEAAEQVPLTGRDLELVPEAKVGLRLAFRTASNEPLSEYALDELRLFLDGDSTIVHALYEAIFAATNGIILRSPGRDRRLPMDRLRAVGFDTDEGLFDEPSSARLGYRLLQEYFTFQEKFLYVDIAGLEPLQKEAGSTFEIVLALPQANERLAGADLTRYFKLGCTPIVNAFEAPPFAVRKDGRQIEYRIEPDHRRPLDHEILAVRTVSSTRPGVAGQQDYRPFFGLQHGDARGARLSFFHTRRAQSTRPDDWGTDVFLSLVDEDYRPLPLDAGDVLHVTALCSNRSRPEQILFGNPDGDFVIEGFPAVLGIVGLRKATSPLRPNLRGPARWQLVSLLSLNHLALVSEDDAEAEAARVAFTELLRLHEQSG